MGTLVEAEEDGVQILRVAHALSDARRFEESWNDARLDASIERALRWSGARAIHQGHTDGWGIRPYVVARRLGLPFGVTVHDWGALCLRGQMRTPAGHRCASAVPASCARCVADQVERGPIRGLVGRWSPPWVRRLVDTFHRVPAGPVPASTHPRAVARVATRQRRLMEAWTSADAVACPSRYGAELLAQHGMAGRVEVIPHGLDAPEPRPLPHGPVIFGFFGTAVATKGLGTLRAVAKQIEGEPFTIEVHGPDRGLDEGLVRHRGPYPPGGGPARMAACHAILVPSTWAENRPVVITEARAAGRPVIASDAGGIREDIRDGVDGLLLPPDEPDRWAGALLALAGDRPRLQRLAAAVRLPPTATQTADRWAAWHTNLVGRAGFRAGA